MSIRVLVTLDHKCDFECFQNLRKLYTSSRVSVRFWFHL